MNRGSDLVAYGAVIGLALGLVIMMGVNMGRGGGAIDGSKTIADVSTTQQLADISADSAPELLLFSEPAPNLNPPITLATSVGNQPTANTPEPTITTTTEAPVVTVATTAAPTTANTTPTTVAPVAPTTAAPTTPTTPPPYNPPATAPQCDPNAGPCP